MLHQWRISDLQKGRQPLSRASTYYLTIFPKLHKNEEILAETGRRVPCAISRSPGQQPLSVAYYTSYGLNIFQPVLINGLMNSRLSCVVNCAFLNSSGFPYGGFVYEYIGRQYPYFILGILMMVAWCKYYMYHLIWVRLFNYLKMWIICEMQDFLGFRVWYKPDLHDKFQVCLMISFCEILSVKFVQDKTFHVLFFIQMSSISSRHSLIFLDILKCALIPT